MRPPYFFTICNPPPPGNSSVLLYAYGSGLLNQFLWQQTSTFDLGIIQGSNPFYKLVKVCFFKTKMDFWYLKARVEWTLDTWPCLCSHCCWFLHLRNWAFIRIWWIWSVQYEGHHQCNGSTDIDPKYNGTAVPGKLLTCKASIWRKRGRVESGIRVTSSSYLTSAACNYLTVPHETQVNSKVGLRWRLWAFFFPHLKPTRNLGLQRESAPGNVSQHLPFHSASCPLELQPAGFRKNCMSFNDHVI